MGVTRSRGPKASTPYTQRFLEKPPSEVRPIQLTGHYLSSCRGHGSHRHRQVTGSFLSRPLACFVGWETLLRARMADTPIFNKKGKEGTPIPLTLESHHMKSAVGHTLPKDCISQGC